MIFVAANLPRLNFPASQTTMSHQSRLIIDQDFSKLDSINPSIWNFESGLPANHELETYTGEGAGNAYIENGNLVLEAKKDANGKITSGRLTSKLAFKYGKVEVVAKVPPGRGTWPAIWMLGNSLRETGAAHVDWPACGEIDIMENVGFDPDNFHTTLHTAKYNWMKHNQPTVVKNIPDGPAKFHKYTLDWTASGMTFDIDGEQLVHWDKLPGGTDAWPFDSPCYLILNLAIGGDWGGAKGVDDSILPCKFLIKSVKVWQG